MPSILQSNKFTVYFYQIILLCYLKGNIVIAGKLIANLYDLANRVKYIDDEGKNETAKPMKEFIMTEEDRDYYVENDTLYNYYYLENTALKLNISDDRKLNVKNHSSKEIDIRIHRQATKLKIHRVLELMKIWFLVYLTLAIPLWCTKGWCCCCLLCKCFKPNKMIEEAKVFLTLNPPGVFQHRGGVIYYEPSENEKDCYEKLEHLIRTI